jgi:hypothetical protein
MMAPMRVQAGGLTKELAEGEKLTFGRARECTVCLDPEDTGMSRVAGVLTWEGGTWWVANSSATRPLAVVDDLGFRSVLGPGRRIAVEAPTKIIVDGTRGRHTLAFAPPPVQVEPVDLPVVMGSNTSSTVTTAIGAEVMVSAADRLAMVALFAGYLEEPPRYDPYPKDYAAAAARLGWKRTTLVKRIEYLRNRLDAAGVPNMKGFNALANLAEYAISRGLVTRADLALLHR